MTVKRDSLNVLPIVSKSTTLRTIVSCNFIYIYLKKNLGMFILSMLFFDLLKFKTDSVFICQKKIKKFKLGDHSTVVEFFFS